MEIERIIDNNINIKLGINKKNELSRLIFEIARRDKIPPAKIFEDKRLKSIINDKHTGYIGKFLKIKQYLVRIRYPNAFAEKDFSVFLNTELSENKAVSKVYSGVFKPERTFVEKSEQDSPVAKRLAGLFPDVKIEVIESLKKYKQENKGDTGDLRKRDIFVTKQNWDFVKICPCTKGVVNCGYHIINLGFGCPYDCSYCYLQQYANFSGIILNSNPESFLENIDTYLNDRKDKVTRIGTGEFTDSLALDHITQYSKILVPYFSGKNVRFELKTKSSNIENLETLEHNGKTLISWSLNPQGIASKEELGTASVEERLKSAKICYNYGYKIGFHFDPIIHYDNWENDYKDLVNLMCDAVPEIEWISLGSLRFTRALKPVIEQRFPGSDYIYDELIIGHDTKMRYYKALRSEIYKKMFGWIRDRNKKIAVYLCMEPKDMWSQALSGQKPYWL